MQPANIWYFYGNAVGRGGKNERLKVCVCVRVGVRQNKAIRHFKIRSEAVGGKLWPECNY